MRTHGMTLLAGILAVCLATSCKDQSVGSSDGDGGTHGADASTGPPTWEPPIDNMGEPGWRDSTEPWCPRPQERVAAFDVWSRPGEVYAVIAHYPSNSSGTEPPLRKTIEFNDGTGWQILFEEGLWPDAFISYSLAGFPTGPLVGWSTTGPGLTFYHEGQAQTEDWMIHDVFVVSDTLAYAIREDKIIYYNGSNWAPVPAVVPYPVYRIWADQEDVFAVGEDGTIISLENNNWRIHDSGTLDSFVSVWGFSGNDVWTGSHNGNLYHYDGQSWTPITWPDQNPPNRSDGIAGMWGAAGVLFFYTYHQLVRWDGEQFTVLGHWPCEEVEIAPGHWDCLGGVAINGIWGNSLDELFLAVTDPEDNSGGCGHEHLLWWDGSQFHWF